MKSFARFLLHLFYAVVILTAVLKSMLLFGAGYLRLRLPDIRALAEAQLGVPIRISNISVDQQPLFPRLVLHDLRLGRDGRLQLGDVELALDPVGLLQGDGQIPVSIRLRQTHIQLLRDEAGNTRVLGLGVGSAATSEPIGGIRLPTDIRIEDASLTWEDRKHGIAPVRFDHLDIRLGRRHNHGLLAARLNTGPGRIELAGRIDGGIFTEQWSADLHLLGVNLDLPRITASYLGDGYPLDSGTLSLEAWSTWQGGRHIQTLGDIRLRDVTVGAAAGPPRQLPALAARFLYRHEADVRELQIPDLHLQQGQTDLRTQLGLRLGDAGPVELALSRLPLDQLGWALELLPAQQDWVQMLGDLAPQGEVRDLHLRWWPPREQLEAAWALTAELHDLGLRAVGQMPGLKGLTGNLRGGSSHLQLDLDSHEAAVYLPQLFRGPIPLQRLGGRIDWLRHGGGWLLRTDSLTADNADLRTRSRMSLQQRPEQGLFLDMQTDFVEGDASAAPTYYPVGIMHPGVVEWLERSIRSGRVVRGTCLVHGPLRDFPFEQVRSGHFEVLFQTEDLVLDYFPGWPPLSEVAAEIRFHNDSLEAWIGQGRLYDSRVEQGEVAIHRLSQASGVEVRGSSIGDWSDLVQLLRESPLAAGFGDWTALAVLTGTVRLDSKLHVAITAKDQHRYSGKLGFRDSGLRLVDLGIELDGLTGDLRIDDQGVGGQGIRGRLQGRPILFDVVPAASATTWILVQADMDAASLRRLAPASGALQLQGAAELKLDLSLPNSGRLGDAPVLQLTSDLKGMAIGLPQPLGKAAEESRSLFLQLHPGREQGQLFLARLGEEVELEGSGRADRGLMLRGRLARLPLGSWVSHARSSEAGTPVAGLELTIGDFSFGPVHASELLLKSDRVAQGWAGTLESAQLSGTFFVPGLPAKPWEFELRRLPLVDIGASLDGSVGKQAAPVIAAELPAIRLDAAEVSINGGDLGQLRLVLDPSQSGYELSRLNLDGPLLSLHGEGYWYQGGADAGLNLNLAFETPDLGLLQERLGFEREFERCDAGLNLHLRLPPDSREWGFERLGGSADLNVGRGQLLEVKPGFGRLFGLINFYALGRRLRLDFQDFFGEGLGMDALTGTFSIDQGQAYTNDLRLEGPSVRIGMAGHINMVDEQLDLLVRVTPRLGAALPLVSTLAGGPVAGVGALIAQGLFPEALDSATTSEYSVTGSWDDPQVDRSGGARAASSPPP